MKKLIALMMALVMVCCAAGALAEAAAEEKTFNAEDFSVKVPAAEGAGIEIAVPESFAVTTGDSVTVSGSSVRVYDTHLTYTMNVPDGFLCFTQDFFASYNAFSYISNPEGLISQMVSEDLHMILYDTLLGNEFDVYYMGQDGVSSYLGDLNALSSGELASFGSAMASANGWTYTGSLRYGSNTWAQFNNLYITVVGGQYVFACFVPDSGTFTEDDDADARMLLRALTISK